MALRKFWVIAYRDLMRNRRRTILTLVAVALGLTLIIFMNGLLTGMLGSALQSNIRLTTGHVQIRAESYEVEKLSLLNQDLLDNPDSLLAQVYERPEVKDATAVLWAGAVLSTIQESTGTKVTGIDPLSPIHDPAREGIVAGEFLSVDDRDGILMGKRLADEMEIEVGDRVALVVGSPDGAPEEGIFTVRGLFNTGFPGYDDNTVFMTLSKAQAFTRTGNRASTIVIMLHKMEDAAPVSAALQGPGLSLLTWEELNAILLTSIETGGQFYVILYAIVILVVAVIIVNTLLMAVFERTREMGILSALGMKSRQITIMFLLEAIILALMGIAVGVVLGSALVIYLADVGIPIGESASSAVEGFAFGTSMYTAFVPENVLGLSLAMLLVVILASLYPARFASRLEPVEALHSL